ncbi:putative leucine-rich repeat protein (LRRP) [Trypanosoma theileri]|uniref:Putative leucine-rich repeat protein (LRRP) n=1 Tax=Trypanosoma theileri TaxID=67003 RepID=A0A1X0NWY3_9TRYP|nr:putative leucine-rich repeat protein (LRRP) [Trypanosoma theileri]ORC89058.1 putative leucine-rich repeat protein (LRRP) [Trypanosoma theileri]
MRRPTPTPTANASGGRRAGQQEFLQLIPLDVDLPTARRLALAAPNLRALPSTVGLLLPRLHRLDLTGGGLRDVAAIATLPLLTSLNLSGNTHLGSIAPLAALQQLTVCVLAHCQLRSLDGLQGSAAKLKSVIANDNQLLLYSPTSHMLAGANSDDVALAVKNYEILSELTACETLVLSRNPHLCTLHVIPDTIEEEEEEETEQTENKPSKTVPGEVPKREADWTHPLSSIEKMTHLRKLSLSGCGLTSLPSHWFLPMVTELRLSHNALKSLIPEGVIFRSVKILDVSHNQLQKLSTLRRCRFVRHLCISGNAFLEEDGELASEAVSKEEVPKTRAKLTPGIVHYLTRTMPNLEVVDNMMLSTLQQQWALEEKEKEKEAKEKYKQERIKKEKEKEEHSETVEEEAKVNSIKKEVTHTSGRKECAVDNSNNNDDIVVEPTELLPTEAPRAPIVRRERTNLIDSRKRQLVADGAAAAQLLMKRKTEGTGW